MNYEAITEAAATIGLLTGRDHHDVAVVLGSGLSEYAKGLPDTVEVPYAEIPGWPVPGVEGHAGSLFSADLGGPTLILAGRVHFYEGHPLDKVVFGVRAAIAAGCRTVVLTNAAGGVSTRFSPGQLVLIRDHLNLTGQNPLIGPNDDRLGPRFPDLTDLYSTRLRHIAHQAAEAVDLSLQEGIYAWLTGPSYETPTEVQMVARLGGDLVGMSTVPEAIAARHMGADVVGISLVTNLAAGLTDHPLTHEEVKQTAATARFEFASLLDELLPALNQFSDRPTPR